VLAPTVFIFLATLAAGVMAYGTDPRWGAIEGGVSLICLSRRLQWPLATAAVVLCLAVVALVVAGKRRAWWLIGLAPVIALFAHTFKIGPLAELSVVENPTFVDAADAMAIGADDYVVGVIFNETPLAFPYAALFNAPIVVHTDRDQRLLLVWNAYANLATAFSVDRTIRAQELDPVSMPANALLVYNTRNGQFINGVTGQTPSGERPAGVRRVMPTVATTWRQWRAAHPATKVVLTTGAASGPTVPLVRAYPLPKRLNDEPDAVVTIVTATRPAAIAETAMPVGPVNFTAGETKVLLLPGPLVGGQSRAFDRQVKEDLFPAFNVTTADAKTGAMLIDADSGTLWTLDGRAMVGPLKGEQLRPLPVASGLDFRVMKYWFPQLTMVTPERAPTIKPTAPERTAPRNRQRRR
jgi:hypothetical protein